MALLKIFKYPHPILREKAAPVTEFDQELAQLAADMADPRDPGIKDRLNRQVKRREPFRPFGPAVRLLNLSVDLIRSDLLFDLKLPEQQPA